MQKSLFCSSKPIVLISDGDSINLRRSLYQFLTDTVSYLDEYGVVSEWNRRHILFLSCNIEFAYIL